MGKTMLADELLLVHQLDKRYGSLEVLRDIGFAVRPGEVVGVAGRSGAGKSTLLNILAGLETADDGEVVYQNKRINIHIGQAVHNQLSVIHQNPELADQLDAITNIFLGQEIGLTLFNGWLNIPNGRRMEEAATRLLTRLDAPFIPLRNRPGTCRPSKNSWLPSRV